tara:strand:- start:47 stop:364 length:318 start_codon:yes stop_codon:yes gene_type:complete
MGNKISLPGDCRGKKKSKQIKQKGPTRWQDAGDTSVSSTRQTRTLSMEITMELMDIESKISYIISIDDNKRTKDHLKELKRLIEYKELKTKELNNPNATTEKQWE